MIVGNHMQANFVTLSSSLTPSAAVSQLSATNYGVVLNATSTPVALVTRADLHAGITSGVATLQAVALPPTVVAGLHADMTLFARSSALLTQNLGSHGAVVLRSEGVADILPLGRVIDFMLASRPAFAPILASLAAPTKGSIDLPSGMVLAGASTSDTTGLAYVICDVCGYANGLYFIPHDPAKMPMCGNPVPPPHVLKLGRSG